MKKDRYILSHKEEERKKQRVEDITRILALILAFVSVFAFFVKLIFL
jgi:uncharacterized membrane protein